jgi:hypothetical protein
MTAISVTSVNVLDNPSKATNPLQFEIQYECMFDLADGELTAATAGPAAPRRCCVRANAAQLPRPSLGSGATLCRILRPHMNCVPGLLSMCQPAAAARF